MNNKLEIIKQLIMKNSSLSKKTVESLVSILIEQKQNLNDLIEALTEIKQFNICKNCNIISNSPKCHNCLNKSKKLILVSNSNEALKLKKIFNDEFKFFIMGSKKSNVNNSNSIVWEKLAILLKTNQFEEVVFCYPPSIDSDILFTLIYNKFFRVNEKKLKLTKLAVGISYGSLLEYSDDKTLKIAMEKRN